ncbi:AAA family ATPase [Stutzerimonas nitrititolerans]|uniref:AAA family ATPase n=1 Tax=Stutzerimonas nitrititolerans TaxID=2482751 RepID=UPI0028A0326B|nr:AAA family ATPase [Stutzerimonas nitrititolerans]
MSLSDEVSTIGLTHDTAPVVVRWMYALLLDMGGCTEFVAGEGFRDNDIAAALGVLGLDSNVEPDGSGEGQPALYRRARKYGEEANASFYRRVFLELRDKRKAHLEQFPDLKLPEPLCSNVERLGNLVGLDEVDRKILAFSAMLASDTLLHECSRFIGPISFNRMLRVLANLLECPQDQVHDRLARSGTLLKAGLIETFGRWAHREDLGSVLQPASTDLAFQLCNYQGDPIGLFAGSFRFAPAVKILREDYRHVAPALGMMEQYLHTALASGQRGVNVLLYGPPGTGKSELTRLMASLLKAELFEISCTDNDGDPIDGSGRLCALRSAMSVLASRRALLVMDEIEDLFSAAEGLAAIFDDRPRHKGWTNRMLEENPVPCFWLTNDIGALDNAYVRRFDMVLCLENPPRDQRKRLVEVASGGRVKEPAATRLAEHEQLTPAVITRAIAVAERACPTASDLGPSVERLVDATLVAQGFSSLAVSGCQTLPSFYSPDLVNADQPLHELVEGIRQHGEARLCFHGPSGTGKTAFGQWIAKELGRPLYSRRASDLVSPYVGMTERNFAESFRVASRDGAVLLLDEVDTFLQDRRTAQHSWEVSAVNEMLTQMESYRGLFIASTNLMDSLDPAAMRRFDLKIHFGYLKPEQISALLDQHLAAIDLQRPATLALARLLRHPAVTPGDFAAVSRRARFKPFGSAGEMIEAVLAEASMKQPCASQPIGFVH